MTPQEIKYQVDLIFQKLDESRRMGAVDLVKVIVATASVLLTIFVSLLPEGQTISYCENKYLFLISAATLLSLLICIAFGFYHLYYSLVGVFNDRFGEIRAVIDEKDSINDLLQRISERKVNIPWLHKHSLKIVLVTFFMGIALLCVYPFWVGT